MGWLYLVVDSLNSLPFGIIGGAAFEQFIQRSETNIFEGDTYRCLAIGLAASHLATYVFLDAVTGSDIEKIGYDALTRLTLYPGYYIGLRLSRYLRDRREQPNFEERIRAIGEQIDQLENELNVPEQFRSREYKRGE